MDLRVGTACKPCKSKLLYGLCNDLIEPSTKYAVCFAIWVKVVHMSSAGQLVELDSVPGGSSGTHVVSRNLHGQGVVCCAVDDELRCS